MKLKTRKYTNLYSKLFGKTKLLYSNFTHNACYLFSMRKLEK